MSSKDNPDKFTCSCNREQVVKRSEYERLARMFVITKAQAEKLKARLQEIEHEVNQD